MRQLNEDPAPARLSEARIRRAASGFEPAAANDAEAPALSNAERTALAMLRCGRSFAEAADSTALDVRRVMAIWWRLGRR